MRINPCMRKICTYIKQIFWSLYVLQWPVCCTLHVPPTVLPRVPDVSVGFFFSPNQELNFNKAQWAYSFCCCKILLKKLASTLFSIWRERELRMRLRACVCESVIVCMCVCLCVCVCVWYSVSVFHGRVSVHTRLAAATAHRKERRGGIKNDTGIFLTGMKFEMSKSGIANGVH